MSWFKVSTIFFFACYWILVATVKDTKAAEQAYQKKARQLHNEYRAKHQVGPLCQSENLLNQAEQCALYYANKGTIDHSCPHSDGAGENLWMQMMKPASEDEAAKSAADKWYAEVSNYDFNTGESGNGGVTGHFTQVVWKESKEFAFAAKTVGTTTVGVGLYSPPGNYRGKYRENVLEKKSTSNNFPSCPEDASSGSDLAGQQTSGSGLVKLIRTSLIEFLMLTFVLPYWIWF